MKKMYRKALVIGKFQPLHKGHLSLIDFAISQADDVVVCATAHSGELIPLHQRVAWLTESYSDKDDIVRVEGIEYDANQLNPSSVSDMQSSIEWADFLRERLIDFSEIDVIVGSEKYVKYMSDYIGIEYIIYDEDRVNIRISATEIKKDVLRYWDYLAPAVKRSYVNHICICGSESTGKTTTCKTLEQECNFVTVIPEIGRCLVGKSEICSLSTLQKIFTIHHDLLSAVINDPPTPIILWDTDNLTTLSYFKFLYSEKATEELLLGKDILLADKYFFFESNIPFEDDGTRFNFAEALDLRDHHIKVYQKHGVQLQFVSSDERCAIVREYIYNQIFETKNIFINKTNS